MAGTTTLSILSASRWSNGRPDSPMVDSQPPALRLSASNAAAALVTTVSPSRLVAQVSPSTPGLALAIAAITVGPGFSYWVPSSATPAARSEENKYDIQSLIRISDAV